MKSFLTISFFCLSAGMLGQSLSLQQQIRETDISDELKGLLLHWVGEGESAKPSQKVNELLYPQLQLRHDHVSKAPVDGCYYGIGHKDNIYKVGGLSLEECKECELTNGKLKKN